MTTSRIGHSESPATSPSVGRAPLQIELRFRLPLPPAETFDLVALRLPEWFGRIHEVRWDNARSQRGPSEVGACSTRTCSIDGKVLLEEIVTFEPGRRYSYRADMGRSTLKMPLRDHLGSFEIDDRGGRGSEVRWRQYFRAAWPIGTFIRWYMRERLMRPAVRSLVEKAGGEFPQDAIAQGTD